MIGIKKELSQQELLWFGPLFALFGGMIGSLAFLKFGSPGVAQGVWGGSLGLIALYYLIPPAREAIFTGWMMVFYPLRWLLSHLRKRSTEPLYPFRA